MLTLFDSVLFSAPIDVFDQLNFVVSFNLETAFKVNIKQHDDEKLSEKTNLNFLNDFASRVAKIQILSQWFEKFKTFSFLASIARSHFHSSSFIPSCLSIYNQLN